MSPSKLTSAGLALMAAKDRLSSRVRPALRPVCRRRGHDWKEAWEIHPRPGAGPALRKHRRCSRCRYEPHPPVEETPERCHACGEELNEDGECPHVASMVERLTEIRGSGPLGGDDD